MFVEKGATNGKLIGTNDAWPGLGTIIPVGNPIFGKSGEFMTKMRGRPFVFKEAVITEYQAERLSRMAEWPRSPFINSDWTKVDLNTEPIIDYKVDFESKFI